MRRFFIPLAALAILMPFNAAIAQADAQIIIQQLQEQINLL